MSEPDTVLLRATCREGHTWDVWGEDGGGRYRAAAAELICPTCPPESLSRAVSLKPQESLA